MTPGQRHRAHVEARDPFKCALAHRGGCAGELQADHVIEKARLRTLWNRANFTGARRPETIYAARLREVTFDELVADGRNGWLLCTDGHHAPKTARLMRRPIELDELPTEAIEFAHWYGLASWLEGLGGRAFR